MIDDWAWWCAEMRWRSSGLAGYIAAFTEVEGRAAEALALSRRVFALRPEDTYELREIMATLNEWAEELGDHPYRPSDPRPDESDRIVRDHMKDVLRDRTTTEDRHWRSGTELSLEVDFIALRNMTHLDCRTRQDAFYLFGRATMALDHGHREAAERERTRLRELRDAQQERG